MAESPIANDFNFELVSPERKLMSERAWQVTIPGYEGDFGVRAGHTSIVSSIRPGVIEVVSQQGSAPVKIFVAGGFADVTATNCTVLAEEAMPVSEIKQETVEKEIASVQGKLAAAKDDIEKARFARQLDLAQARLSAVTGHLAA